MGNSNEKKFVAALKTTDKTKWGTYEDIMKNVQNADIIEIDRGGYRHFAMFVGEQEVTDRGVCVDVYEDEDTGKGKRHIQYLDIVIKNDPARINNLGHEARSRQLTERPLEDQLSDAKRRLSTITHVDFDYSALNNNCECAVTKWKYGVGFSKQVDNKISRTVNGKLDYRLLSRSSSSRNYQSVGGSKNVKSK